MDLSGLKILLVDDEEAVRDVAELMLGMLGLEVESVADGREAFSVFVEDPDRYHLVLLDLTMPELDGRACFLELRRVRSDVRVILSSGYNEQELAERFTGFGFAAFIQKPYSIDRLKAVLTTALQADAALRTE